MKNIPAVNLFSYDVFNSIQFNADRLVALVKKVRRAKPSEAYVFLFDEEERKTHIRDCEAFRISCYDMVRCINDRSGLRILVFQDLNRDIAISLVPISEAQARSLDGVA